MNSRTLVVIFAALLSACASRATILRADGSSARGTLVHADDDIVVLRNATLIGNRNAPAPFTNLRGRAVYSRHEAEVAIPRDDVVRLTAINRHARTAGIVGSVLTGVGLIVLVPSALALQNCQGSQSMFHCTFESAGTGVGSIMLVAGLITGITGWILYGVSYRDESGDVVPLAPSITDAMLRF